MLLSSTLSFKSSPTQTVPPSVHFQTLKLPQTRLWICCICDQLRLTVARGTFHFKHTLVLTLKGTGRARTVLPRSNRLTDCTLDSSWGNSLTLALNFPRTWYTSPWRTERRLRDRNDHRLCIIHEQSANLFPVPNDRSLISGDRKQKMHF